MARAQKKEKRGDISAARSDSRKRKANLGTASTRSFWHAQPVAAREETGLPVGDKWAKISITGGFTLVDALIEGYNMFVAFTAPGKAEGERKIRVEGIISISLRFISTDANVAKAVVSIDGKDLKPPVQIEVPAGDTGYVSFFRNM